MSDIKLSVGLETSIAGTGIQDDLNELLRNLEATKPKISIDIELSKNSLSTFQKQLTQIVKTTSLGSGAPININVDGLKKITSEMKDVRKEADKTEKALDDVSKSAENIGKKSGGSGSIDTLVSGTEEYNKALKSVNDMLIQLEKNQRQWTAASSGAGSEEYQDYVNQIQKLRTLYNEVMSGSVGRSDFAMRMSEIKLAASDAAEAITNLGENQKAIGTLTAGTVEYNNALERTDKLLKQMNQNKINWSMAETGAAAMEFQDYVIQIQLLRDLWNDVVSGSVTKDDFALRLSDIRSNAAMAAEAIANMGENQKAIVQMTDGMKEYNDALTKINRQLIQLQNSQKRWSEAETGNGSQDYAKLTEQIARLRVLQEEVMSGKMSRGDFEVRLSEIQMIASEAAESLTRLSSGKSAVVTLSDGMKEYSDSVTRVNAEISKMRKNLDQWSGAKSGTDEARAQYEALERQLIELEDLRDRLTKADPIKLGLTKSEFDEELSQIKSMASQAAEALDRLGENQKSAFKLTSETKEYSDALTKINQQLIQLQASQKKWAYAEDSVDGAKHYQAIIEQMEKLRKLEAQVSSGNMLRSDFDKQLSNIKQQATAAAEALTRLAASGKISAVLLPGTREYSESLAKVNSLLQSVRDNQEKWTAAKNGKSSDAYNELTEYTKDLQKLIADLEKGTMSVEEFNQKLAQIKAGVSTARTTIKAAGEDTKSLGDKVAAAAAKFSSWLSVSQVIMFAVHSVKQMVTNVIELDTAMTELKKVTDETEATYDRFLDNAVARAKNVGASLSDVVTATADFARLGYTIDEASTLADTAIIYKNVGDGIENISQASESIISTMQAFGVEAEHAMSIVDKFNAVGNAFAISSTGIGEAMQRSAAAMNAAGNNIDQTIALITAANTVVQNPESVGTTLKTVSMFLRAAKTEAEEAGESTEGMADSVSELRDEILDLTGEKVDIQIDDDTFKSTYDILKEISAVWDSLTDVSQANLLELLGGKRNANVVSALIENFDIAEDVLKVSAESAGSAIAENEKYLDSIQGQIARFQASWQALSASVINSEFVKAVVSVGTVIMDTVTAIIESLGGLGVALTALPTLSFVSKLKPVAEILDIFKDAGRGVLKSFPKLIDNATSAFGAFRKAAQSGASGAKSFGEALNTLWSGFGAFGKIAIVTAAIAAVISICDVLTVSAEEARENLANLKQEYADNASEIDSLNNELTTTRERIMELQSLDTLTFTEQEELSNLQAQNNELSRKIELLKYEQELKQKGLNASFVETMQKNVASPGSHKLGLLNSMPEDIYLKDQLSAYERNLQAINDLDEKYAGKSEGIMHEWYKFRRQQLVDSNDEIATYLSQKSGEFSEYANGISYIESPNSSTDKAVNNWLDYINDFNDKIYIALGLDGAKESALDRLTSGSFKDVTNDLKELGEQGEVTAENLREEKYESFINKLVELGVIADTSDASLELLASYFNDTADSAGEAAAAVEESASSFDTLKEKTSGVISELDKVTQLINEQSTGASISVDTYDELIAISDEYAGCLEYQNGALQLNADMMREIAAARAEDQAAAVAQSKALAQTEYLKNAAEIERLRAILADTSKYKTQGNVENIQATISALSAENGELLTQIDRYNLLAASISEAQSAYQHWINAQNASQTGDMFDGAISAIQHINNTLNNAESDLYGRVGRTDYQAAVDFIVPDTVDKEDADAVNAYMDSISDMFTFDDSGNQTGLNIANFCQNAVDAGLMVLNEAGTAYEIAGGKTMEDFANGLGLSLPLVQAMFGELEEFGAKFDWADEADKTFRDIAVSATEAAEQLRQLDGYGDLKVELDVSTGTAQEKIDKLKVTIDEMQNLKTQLDVDSSEYEYANQVIEYCVMQQQQIARMETPVLNVDISQIQGKYAEAIALLQEFSRLNNELELKQALNIDTGNLDSQIADIAGKIQSLDDQTGIMVDIGVNTESIDSISSTLAGIDYETLTVTCGIDDSAIIGYEAPDKDSTVVYDKDSTIPDEYQPEDKTADVIYGVIHTDVDNYNPSNIYRKVVYQIETTGSAPSSVNGTAHAGGTAHVSGTALASGDWGTAPGGPTLVAELGPEIVVNPKTGKWYTVGENGAEFVNIPKGAIVFNHKQSESLLKYGYVDGRGTSMASGTAMVTGSIPISNRWPGSPSSGNGGGSGNYHNDRDDRDENSVVEDTKNAFEEAYKYHQHLLNMEQEDLEDYLRWLEQAYKDAYANGEIELDDYYKYEEEVYEGRKDLFQNYLDTLEHKIEGLGRQDGNNGQIINLYLGMIKDIRREIAEARARGLDENDEYIQELLQQIWDYQDEIDDIRESAHDDAKSAVEDLIDYRIDMLKKDLENEKDALEDKKDALKDFYDEQKDMLQKSFDEEKRIEERNEKRKAKTDIEAELAQLEFDDSAWAQKRKLELREELAAADKDLKDFEKENTLDDMKDLLDSMYEKQAAQIDTQIEAIEAKLNDPEALYNQALKDIQNNTQALYMEMVEYNAKYGTGNPEDIKEMWDEAKASLDEFLATFGQAYKDIILVASPGTPTTGYASGTRSAAPGAHKVDEKGAEYVFTSSDGNKYRVFSGGEKVLSAGATDFLYDFAVTEGRSMKNMFANLLNAFNFAKVQSKSQPIQLTTGDIIVQGNADQKTISEIRRAQRDGIDYILKQFTKLNK